MIQQLVKPLAKLDYRTLCEALIRTFGMSEPVNWESSLPAPLLLNVSITITNFWNHFSLMHTTHRKVIVSQGCLFSIAGLRFLDKEIYHGLLHSRTVKPVEIIHGAMKK